MDHEALPLDITKYFWGDNLKELSLTNHKLYIMQTLLEKGDQKAIKWLFKTVGRDKVKNALAELKLGEKSARFWYIYL